jgi:hypothetical protein
METCAQQLTEQQRTKRALLVLTPRGPRHHGTIVETLSNRMPWASLIDQVFGWTSEVRVNKDTRE